MKGTDDLENTYTDGRILQWSYSGNTGNTIGGCGLDSTCSGQGRQQNSSEQGNYLLDSIKGMESFD
jgi:hypothetical protein